MERKSLFDKYELNTLSLDNKFSKVTAFEDAVKSKKGFQYNAQGTVGKVLFNGVGISYIALNDHGSLKKVNYEDDLLLNDLWVPGPSVVEIVKVDNKEIMYIKTESTVSSAKYNSISFLSNKSFITTLSGVPIVGISGEKQIFRNQQIFKYQPLFFNNDGEFLPFDAIKHYDRKYTFEKIGNADIFPYEIGTVGIGNFGPWIEIVTRRKISFLGNECTQCIYTLCPENKKIYVYLINGVTKGRDKIQGRMISSSKGRFYYYENGESVTPHIDAHDGDVPFADRCTFKSAHGDK